MKIIVIGAGMQGTLFAVRLASANHSVSLVARGARATELRQRGAIIEHAMSGKRQVVTLPVVESLDANAQADLSLVTVRREQINEVLPLLQAAPGVGRILFLVNNAGSSDFLFERLGRARIILGFPGAAGSLEAGIDRYVEVREQATVIEARAPDLCDLLRGAGFRVSLVPDMDSWLRRHAVFVTAVGGALYAVGGDTGALAHDKSLVRTVVVAVREGWAAMDRRSVGPASLALRAIFEWVPLPVATWYWQRLLGSARGRYYFAPHARHAVKEMVALAKDVRELMQGESALHLSQLYAAIDRVATNVP
jgi:2-dehydropantoate 2-reductase